MILFRSTKHKEKIKRKWQVLEEMHISKSIILLDLLDETEAVRYDFLIEFALEDCIMEL